MEHANQIGLEGYHTSIKVQQEGNNYIFVRNRKTPLDENGTNKILEFVQKVKKCNKNAKFYVALKEMVETQKGETHGGIIENAESLLNQAGVECINIEPWKKGEGLQAL